MPLYFTRFAAPFLIICACFSPHIAGAQNAAQEQTPSSSAAPSSDTSRAISEWMMGYYKKPTPERVPEAILALDGFTKDSGAALFAIGFMAAVFEQNPANIATWLRDIDNLGDKPRNLLLQAAWMSGTPEAQEFLIGYGSEKLIATFKVDISSRAANGGDSRLLRIPADLDYYWGRFFATGRDVPVLRVIAALPWQDNKPITTPVTPEEKALAMRWAMGKAAQWALTANAARDERVLEVCKVELSKSTGPSHDHLQQVVTTAETRRAASRI